jgi:hypothetical protein
LHSLPTKLHTTQYLAIYWLKLNEFGTSQTKFASLQSFLKEIQLLPKTAEATTKNCGFVIKTPTS